MIIHNKDCLEYMIEMEEDSVDFVFTDPPYNAGKDYGVYKDNLSEEAYERWMSEILYEMQRISKRGICVYTGSKMQRLMWKLLPPYTQMVVVHKRAIGPRMNNFFLQYHCLFCTAKPNACIKDLWTDVRLPGEGYFFREPRFEGMPGLTSLKMTARVIESFTEPEELVFDPFSGVGTTAVACQALARKFIGTELNHEFIQIAYDRLAWLPEMYAECHHNGDGIVRIPEMMNEKYKNKWLAIYKGEVLAKEKELKKLIEVCLDRFGPLNLFLGKMDKDGLIRDQHSISEFVNF